MLDKDLEKTKIECAERKKKTINEQEGYTQNSEILDYLKLCS